jgi:hypothetical protein
MTVFSLAGCFPGDPLSCLLEELPDASAASLVKDPLAGTHTGTWSWLETMKTTTVTVTVAATGPVTALVPQPGSDPCQSSPRVNLDMSVQTGDGLVQVPSQSAASGVPVDPDGGVAPNGLGITFDPAPLLAGGAAPEEPELASQDPTAVLLLDLATDGALKGGTLTVTGATTHVTLATVTF